MPKPLIVNELREIIVFEEISALKLNVHQPQPQRYMDLPPAKLCRNLKVPERNSVALIRRQKKGTQLGDGR
jgi:hypothetical protein